MGKERFRVRVQECPIVALGEISGDHRRKAWSGTWGWDADRLASVEAVRAPSRGCIERHPPAIFRFANHTVRACTVRAVGMPLSKHVEGIGITSGCGAIRSDRAHTIKEVIRPEREKPKSATCLVPLRFVIGGLCYVCARSHWVPHARYRLKVGQLPQEGRHAWLQPSAP